MSRVFYSVSLVQLLLLLLGATPLRAADTTSRTPILLELFTSEGCSSCPPVDAWVQRLDAAQPVPGAEIIVLSEHVDYWDHQGWKDPFSSAEITHRQEDYVRRLGLSDVYTPQVIVDGDFEIHPADTAQVRQGLQKAAQAKLIPVTIGSVSVENGSSGFLTGRVSVNGANTSRGAEVFVALALDKVETDVLGGENDGRKLTNIAVVKKIIPIGKLDGTGNIDQAFRIKLWPSADRANLRAVAFVQEPAQGGILGVAMTREIAVH